MQQIVSTVAIVYCQGKFLLVRRALDDDIFPGKWQSAGGKVEPGETIEEAVQRELLEETGVAIGSELRFVMSYAWQKSPSESTRLGIILLAALPGKNKDVSITLDAELCEYGWFTLAEAAKLDTIGRESSTGTFAQLQKASQLLSVEH
ncbi:MAG TPA: NUDIX hydrolase [Candidatus Saccharimonadales bacterium]|nr:NUDIX hydrolase [Candidatus Saccharimonadales bacterium]